MERCSANVAYIYSDLNTCGVASAPSGSVYSSMASGGVGGPPGSGLSYSSAGGAIHPSSSLNHNALGSSNPGPVTAPHIAADENYCLRWNEYEKKYAETFRILRDDEYFTDVTLATEGHSVKAHRVILSACSNYFHAILKTMSPWQHPVLLLHDVRSADLNSLMDFIYFGQASVSQDSLQSFLRVAEKLKIKGLCETLAPPPPPPIPLSVSTATHVNTITSPLPVMGKEMVMNQNSSVLHSVASSGPQSVSFNNFEGLLPRSPFIPEPSVVPLTQTPSPTPLASVRTVSSAPPLAHQQNSRQSMRGVGPPPPQHSRATTESIMHYATPKRAKYASVSPQSILRSQLQLKDSAENVEVKSEPMAILSSQEDVPSSGMNVTEFMSAHENDLALQSLGHGISPQFMFSPDPSDGSSGPAGGSGPPPPVATMVTIDEKSVTSSASSATSAGSIIQTSNSHHMQSSSHSQHQHLVNVAPPNNHSETTHRHDEPQDLTPGPQDSPHLTHTPPNSNNGNGSLHSTPSATPTSGNASMIGNSPSTPTPPKKDRNSRKTCNYCHKDFHEMSLKRHIKDVHFRSQNTYVICPQCCKQYASQNSLYSHLNRVHGVKKEMLTADMQMQMVQQQQQQQQPQQHQGSSGGSNATENSTPAGGGGDNNHQDGIMDLAHHSDSSN